MPEHAIHVSNLRCIETRKVERCQIIATLKHALHTRRARGVKSSKIHRFDVAEVLEELHSFIPGMNSSFDFDLRDTRLTISVDPRSQAALIKRAFFPVFRPDGEYPVGSEFPHARAAFAAFGSS